MRRHHAVMGLVLLTTVGCSVAGGPSVNAPALSDVASPRYHLLALAPVAAVDADSQLSSNPAAYAVDGNTSTAWSNGGYRNPTAWLRLRFGVDETIASVAVRMPPAATGTRYDLQVSADGTAWQTVRTGLTNTTWNFETKTVPTGTHGRYLRIFWRNSASAPQPHVAIYEVAVNRGTGTSSPSPSPTSSPTSSPSATPTPAPSGSYPRLADPGPFAATGIVYNNGVGVSGITIKVGSKSATTDSRGVYRVTGLSAGNYQAYYYNPTDRNKIGYWRSRPLSVDGTHGASFPTVDLYLRGMVNTPAPGAQVRLPATFTWLGPVQPVVGYFFRVHSEPYTSFQLVFQSAKLPGTTNSYTWNGGSATLDPNHRYFWGVQWDWGDLGQGGNLYQPAYFIK